MSGYPFKKIEIKWRKWWEDNATHHVDLNYNLKKKYILVMFSYPSEKRLHIGHWWNYGGVDTYSRYMRMRGYNVFEPMGFDAFGLPAENYAIKHGVHPAITTRNSVDSIREQLKTIGAMYDWNREVDTSKPEYYKWTQWLFLQLFKNGAAYRKKAPVNWCPECQTVLANEQVESDGSCERCGIKVTMRNLEQWFFRITDFADDLLESLNSIDMPEATKSMQRHWIGRSEGTEIDFAIDGHNRVIHCFTTRADTLFGATYVVLAPEHDLVQSITTAEHRKEVLAYIDKARSFSEIERLTVDREKTGVFTGAYAINPANNDQVPIWIADYVLAGYGTGAVMAVPAHDQRDFEFANKYKLPIVWVINPVNNHDTLFTDCAFETYGIMHDSGLFDGLATEEGTKCITKWLDSKDMGRATISYRLRDWLISRQRYWGAPIPVIHCPSCGIVPVPEDDLPVLLPEENVDFTPRGSSPLGSCREFIETKCPRCGEVARRDPDTMDTFVCSSWYYLRYLSTDTKNHAFDKDMIAKWLPIDTYIGGPEHATGHLIYARYITKYLNSIGEIQCEEPFLRLIHQGIITHKGQRMSKSKGNVVNPDEFIEKYGSDCFRLYLMFMGDFRAGGDWSDEGIIGIRRFQNRVWRLVEDWKDKVKDINFKDKTPGAERHEVFKNVTPELNELYHYTIMEVTKDLENFEFNTAISRLMEYVNELYKYTADINNVDLPFVKDAMNKLTILLGPLAPHMSEELWEMLGNEPSLFNTENIWPVFRKIERKEVTVVVQVNGKLTDRLTALKGSSEEVVRKMALESNKTTRKIANSKIKRIVYVQDKIINIVI